MKPLSVINVVGTRPNFVKIAPLMAVMTADERFAPRLVHTGQHYDRAMAQVFFEELGIPEPDVNLGVGSGAPAWQTGEIMARFEKILLESRPDLVIVVGDVNSTLACALAAAKNRVPVAHVEAGLRSFDRTMPEELNRVLTDHAADLLFISEPAGVENLKREGIPDERVHVVGNIMIDTLIRCRPRVERSDIHTRLGMNGEPYAVLTAHRPSSVDDPDALARLLDAVERIQRRLPVVFPIHPRTRRRLSDLGLDGRIAAMSNLRMIDPLGYIEFTRLLRDARLVLTDSGGIQEETCLHGAPCVVLRENTERPVTLGSGYHALVGTETERIVAQAGEYLAAPRPKPFEIELWDGRTAERIADVLTEQADSLRAT